MTIVKPSTVTQASTADPDRVRLDVGADEPYVPHFKPLNMPGVASGPLLPEPLRAYFRKRFRRKSAPATR
jgi:hypothetical protein